jgi:hypothetical protein
MLREILVYCIVGISSLLVMGYAVHMLVGGIVSEETELLLIALICLADLAAISYMVWDVVQHRKNKR